MKRPVNLLMTWLACVILPVAMAGAAETTNPSTAPAGPEPSAALRELLAKPVPDVITDEMGFDNVIDFLRDVTGANIHVDWRSLEKVGVDEMTPVSARLHGVALEKVLDVTLKDASTGKATYLAAGDVIWIMSKEAAPRRLAAMKLAAKREIADPAVKALMEKRVPDIRFDKIGFSDTIDFLRDITGANIVVNWQELEANGVDRDAPVSLRARGMKFGDTLNLILESLPGEKRVNFSVEDNVITIEVEKPSAA